MSHIYSGTFFDYIDASARASAQSVTQLLSPQLRPASVIDLGCGRGVWLDEWQRASAADVLGADGAYVDPDTLEIARDAFLPTDLTRPLATGRRFDLAQSLEVGEHLPADAAETLVQSLTTASDRVLFSAAVVGQGGEFHINERPLSYWQGLFEARGYRAYDCVRPHLHHNRAVAPWYRYNTILYVNDAGRAGLPEAVLHHEVPAGTAVKNGGDALWRLRCAVLGRLPQPAVTRIAQLRAALLARRARSAAARAHASA
ncbi:class I SAM-dependent methyltransferase [Roseobacter sinensis]|uniref:Class I SAM-dependent methyltransferase n=1 Tax=Roseobacter sinensis TaxID=2931391 RepID=A0ABT3BD94_9RHOB|nr:class I SAM-dependent methyltransferase [Roseobacter sp. WL0113]MCV3271540.1 class I SAM-dependent methyltransferase [Roseobacter sp. WL0113]